MAGRVEAIGMGKWSRKKGNNKARGRWQEEWKPLGWESGQGRREITRQGGDGRKSGSHWDGKVVKEGEVASKDRDQQEGGDPPVNVPEEEKERSVPSSIQQIITLNMMVS